MLTLLIEREHVVLTSASAICDTDGRYGSRKRTYCGPEICSGWRRCRVVLGSTRTTQGVDFVVLRGQTPAARELLRASPHFNVEPGTKYTTCKAEGANGVEIEILAPPALFKENFDQDTEVITVGNVKVLKPALILNAKCRSILGRSTEHKRNTDAVDILFLLEFCARNPKYLPKAEEVPNANREFGQMFIAQYENQESWTRAGYNLQTGLFSVPRLTYGC